MHPYRAGVRAGAAPRTVDRRRGWVSAGSGWVGETRCPFPHKNRPKYAKSVDRAEFCAELDGGSSRNPSIERSFVRNWTRAAPVSYTHLTLPTITSV